MARNSIFTLARWPTTAAEGTGVTRSLCKLSPPRSFSKRSSNISQPAVHTPPVQSSSLTRLSTAQSVLHLSPKCKAVRAFSWTTEARNTFHSAQPARSGGASKAKRGRLFTRLAAAVVVIGAIYLIFIDDDERLLHWRVGNALNGRSFVPFTIVARVQVSPTSFIITVEPKYSSYRDGSADFLRLPRSLGEAHPHRAVLERAWRHGLWSVEIKQPQLQVAREYTPLPPPLVQDGDGDGGDGEADDLARGRLRFLVRAMPGGEVSTYLSCLGLGDTVELRGPHLGFDLRARLGAAGNQRVVFLAGGTGIAPALQAVRALLLSPPPPPSTTTIPTHESVPVPCPSVSIIWANRHRADCIGCDDSSVTFPAGDNKNKNPVVAYLSSAAVKQQQQQQQQHGGGPEYACVVDDEGTFISARAIASAVSPTTTATAPTTSTKQQQQQQLPSRSLSSSEDCHYHSARLLTGTGPNDDSGSAAQHVCACPGGSKNLLLVSGPDGFVAAYAGAKVWAGGKELQGPVGGVVGDLQRRRRAGQWGDWLVLKL
ncbi:hypothetical protein B0T24DRAFT_409401 [Lasiosphaeria ovina]|uniref:FAD-binding FR-type domain-containing protein n=1 Tax=Lasiosphaeria ovina TaxID=92902 RepID=A0AAE0N056_9PEZI|nr:hypothetical protein B0T24DRAFT_409401 [Lasiosphaeria ovina]